MSDVKRYVTTCDCMSPAAWGDYVRYDDYAALEAELAKLRAELERLPVDGWKLVPVERITIALESVQNAMEDAYNNAYQECCGRGQGQCCGDPVAAWSDADTAIMDALAPAQRELSALLAAAPSASKAGDPVKVELLGALEDVVAWAYRNTKWDCIPIGLVRAQCAIAAARQEGGKV